MNTLEKHEILEIETLEKLKNAGFFEPLVFGGGTMLRLCHELNRYSADLDFWFIKTLDPKVYFKKLKKFLAGQYDLTDAQIKFYTLLFEFRAKDYPKRLKIEIRKEKKPCDFQEMIAFSKYSTKQVLVRAHTLKQAMQNKIKEAIERVEIRDYFDIEFLLRRGVPLQVSGRELAAMKKAINSFSKTDYSVTLGAILDSETRKYYIDNGFCYLLEKM